MQSFFGGDKNTYHFGCLSFIAGLVITIPCNILREAT